MKYLDGSGFTVHVGGSAYAEGWDRIFGQRPSAETMAGRVVGSTCHACGQEMDPKREVLGKHAEGDGWMCLNGDCAGVASTPTSVPASAPQGATARVTIPCRNGRHEACAEYREWAKMGWPCACECHG